MSIAPVILTGQHVILQPLSNKHREELRYIAQDDSLWTYYPYKASGQNFDRFFDSALAGFENRQQLPFAVYNTINEQIIGSTRLYEISPENRRLRIGYTWYAQNYHGTLINPECKFLLLQYAFETLDFVRVEFSTDARHLHSIAAILKLGATEEGILRKHMILEDGYIRDTVIFSIIKSEWPQVKSKLHNRLSDMETKGGF